MSRHKKTAHFKNSIVNDLLNEIVLSLPEKSDVLAIVSSILNDVLSDACDKVEDTDDPDSDETEEEDYIRNLRARDKYVAEVQAEFRRCFPTFEEELRSLKRPKKTRKRTKRDAVPAIRKSARLSACRSDMVAEEENVNVEQAEGDSDAEDIVEVSLVDNSVEQENSTIVVDDDFVLEAVDYATPESIDQDIGKFACLQCNVTFR